jgi:LPS-assembly protein
VNDPGALPPPGGRVVTSGVLRGTASFLLLACLCAVPETASALEQQKNKRTQTTPIPGASEDIRLRADRQESVEKGHYRAVGLVDVQSGDVRVQSDQLDIYTTDKPDGSSSKRFVFEGNVVFLRGDERLAGRRLDLDLDTGHGVIEDAAGFVQPGVYVEAARIERIDAGTYRIEGGRFTSCAQPNPRWGFTSTSATLQLDDKIKARNVFFKLKSIPLLYLPYLIYPIQDDQRSSGLLMPHLGYSSFKGFGVGAGFFWAMGRGLDQTFYADHYSKIGFGFGHELRWALDAPSRGTFKTYVFEPKNGQPLDYDLDWTALQLLPRRFRATAVVRQYSNMQFQQSFQDNFNLATTRTRRSALNIQGPLTRSLTAQFAVDSVDTYFGETTRTNRRLPSLRVARTSRKIGRSGVVFGLDSRAEFLGRNDLEDVSYYSRFDIAPEISRPFSTTFLQLTPRVRPRFTYYGASIGEIGHIDGPGLTRPFFEGALESRGPTFSRVFGNPLGFYTDKIKHVIGPEVTWSYRTRVEDFNAIPKFDGFDQLLGTNQVDYALVQRLLARRPGPSGRLIPHEFLTWRLQQSYYFQINDKQNEFDPNYSSAYFGPGGVPAHYSPLLSRLRVRPTPLVGGSFDVEYDTNFKQLRSLSLGAEIGVPRLSFQGGWFRAKQVARQVERRIIYRDAIRGQGRLQLLPGRLTLDGSVDYDLLLKTLMQSRARLKWDVQCCGFTVEMIQYKYNERDERQIRFSIELANIGSMGNFNGADEAAMRGQGLAGYR